MNIISGVFKFYLNASIHVAIAVCALVGVTALEFALAIPLNLWFFVFFGTITGYNFVKYAEVAGVRHRTLRDSLKSIQLFSMVSFCGMLFFGVQLATMTLFVIGIFGLLTYFYATPLLKHKNLRTLGGLKVFIVAFVWAGVTVIVPLIEANLSLETDHWVTFVQRYLIVIVLTLPFEIRDLQYDISNLKTLPQILGVKKVKFLGVSLLLIVLFLDGFKDEFTYAYFINLAIICILIGMLLLVSKIRQPKYFASFWVESLSIIWVLLLLLGSQLF